MGLFQRVGDIISANFNEMIEKYEDPEKMLKQAIREMDTSIAEAKQETAKAMASEKLIQKNLADNERHGMDWQERAQKAVLAGDDAMARKALLRKQEHDKVVAALQDQLSAASEASQTLRHQLEAMQAKLAEAKRRIGTLTARKKAAEVRAKIQNGMADTHMKTDAFEKFDRLREKVDRVEAEAEAFRELDRGSRGSLDVEPAVEKSDLDVEAELEALKQKFAK